MRHPHIGISGAKPRIPKPDGNGAAATKEALARLSEDYLRARNDQMASKAAIAAMELARRRGELIDKRWAFDSLSYVLVCYRQKALLAHRTIARRLVRLGFIDAANEHGAAMVLDEEIRLLLAELANMPDKVTDPNWLRKLEQENVGADTVERQSTPREHQREQARVTHRRAMKTEAKRRQRAKG